MAKEKTRFTTTFPLIRQNAFAATVRAVSRVSRREFVQDSVKICVPALTQKHADFLEALFYFGAIDWKAKSVFIVPSRLRTYLSPYKARLISSVRLRVYVDQLRDVGDFLVDEQLSGDLIDGFHEGRVEDEGLAKLLKTTRATATYWQFVMGNFLVESLKKCPRFIYNPRTIIKMKHGISKRLARYAISLGPREHVLETEKTISSLLHPDFVMYPYVFKKMLKHLKNDEKRLKRCGILVNERAITVNTFESKLSPEWWNPPY